MIWLGMGAVFLLFALTFLYLFVSASPTAVRNSLIWVLGLAGLLFIGVMLATGRGASALWALIIFGPALMRAFQNWRARRAFSRPGEEGGASVVETPTLEMRLDLSTGAMSGKVRRGTYTGRDLASLDRPDLLSLLMDCATQDAESVPLIEAWLDRTDPGWRDEPPPAQPGGGPMTRAEALAVLGLEEGASPTDIRAAHRRLMQTAHPDRGGSDWLASRVNEARDLLLG